MIVINKKILHDLFSHLPVFILGVDVDMLEEEFAAYCGTKFAVGVDSGLAALEMSLRALGIGSGHEVIVPTHTFTATAAAVTFAGATPESHWSQRGKTYEESIVPSRKKAPTSG